MRSTPNGFSIVLFTIDNALEVMDKCDKSKYSKLLSVEDVMFLQNRQHNASNAYVIS